MIQLNPECLYFSVPGAGTIPCSAEAVTVELIGEAAEVLSPDVVRHAASAVLHYFREELGRLSVTVGEFAQALARVLRGFGLVVSCADGEGLDRVESGVVELDLRKIAVESGKAYELLFFPSLRRQLSECLQPGVKVMKFRGLRGCVKQLLGARRWSPRCQVYSDQLVAYLRASFSIQGEAECALLVK